MGHRTYLPRLTCVVNRKGVLDIDTVKGCTLGIEAHPDGGCYGLCYANRLAVARGFDFSRSVSREVSIRDQGRIASAVRRHPTPFFRIGTMGDPCHDWPLTLAVCSWLGPIKTPVVITKHWLPLSDADLSCLSRCGAIVNTSISALDSDEERAYRLDQFRRIGAAGVRSVLRIVSARFGTTDEGRRLTEIQTELFQNSPIIDNPLRIPTTDARVLRGDILVERHPDLGGGSTVSVASSTAYLGQCVNCSDQCGVNL